ncbi:hypothetical protein ACH4VR_40400 [Streptomyces sp. NPDC020883]|uniref:DUF7848 domain-containing protein n=1 Tax=Streptomyces sp. NPDC020883 TaxID=3365099 RepID=UPI0037BA0768
MAAAAKPRAVARGLDALSPWEPDAFAGVTGAQWALIPETAQGAPRIMYAAECMACPDECWMDDNPRPVEAWTVEHTRSYPKHHQFLLTVQKHGRVIHQDHDLVPEPSNAPAAAPAPSGWQSPGPRCHARVRPTRRCSVKATRAVAYAGRYVGVVFIVTVSVACGLVLGTALAAGRG